MVRMNVLADALKRTISKFVNYDIFNKLCFYYSLIFLKWHRQRRATRKETGSPPTELQSDRQVPYGHAEAQPFKFKR